MRKPVAFVTAFLGALAVALVPLGITDLSRTGAQPVAEAQQAVAAA